MSRLRGRRSKGNLGARPRGREKGGGKPSRVLGLSRALAILFPFSFKRLPDRLVSEP